MNHSLIIITLVNFHNEKKEKKRRKFDTHSKQIHDLSRSWLGTGTPTESDRVKLLN